MSAYIASSGILASECFVITVTISKYLTRPSLVMLSSMSIVSKKWQI